MTRLPRLKAGKGKRVHEADVSAQSAPPEEDPRLSGAHEDQGRTESAQAPPGQGAQTADRLTGRFPRSERLTSSAEIQALFQQGKRIETPSLIVLWRDTDTPCRAGFAVTRQIRGSVRRNRARRRLREAFRAARGATPPRAALMVVGKRGALDAPLGDLTEQLRRALAALPGPRGGR